MNSRVRIEEVDPSRGGLRGVCFHHHNPSLQGVLMSWSISRVSNLWLGCVLAMLFGSGLAAPQAAQADAEQEAARVKYRQMLMSGVGSDMGGIGDILKNQLDLPGHIESHARQLAESSKLIGAAFKAQISEGATDAKPDIWQDWQGFQERIAELEKTARGLESAAAGSDPAAMGPAVKALGKSCGGCHKAFRKPKEDSYKNQ
jgi:cytochrome c556